MNELQAIQSKIYELRGQKVMLDFDLAEMYGVETRVLNQAVKRNMTRFPEDFMFQLSYHEWETMSSQIVTTSPTKLLGHSRKAAPSEAEEIISKIGRPRVNIYWGMEPK